jgi:hypothetical protein
VSLINQLIRPDIIDIRIDAKIATHRLSNLNPGTRAATRYRINPLITNINRPKLNTVIGKVKNIKSGLKMEFNNPRRIAVKINDTGLSALTHGKILTTTKIARAVIKVLNRNFFKSASF